MFEAIGALRGEQDAVLGEIETIQQKADGRATDMENALSPQDKETLKNFRDRLKELRSYRSDRNPREEIAAIKKQIWELIPGPQLTMEEKERIGALFQMSTEITKKIVKLMPEIGGACREH